MKVTSTNINTKDIHREEFAKTLKIGDVIKGRVVDAREGRIVIKLSSQQNLDAAIDPKIVAEKGSIIELVITDLKADTIYAKMLKTVKDKLLSNDSIINGLKDLGLSVTERNAEILKALIKYNQPVSKDIVDYINYIMKTSEAFSNKSMEELLALALSEEDIVNTPLHNLPRLASSPDLEKIIAYIAKEENISSSNDINNIRNIIEKIMNEYKLDEGMAGQLKLLFNESLEIANVLKDIDLETLLFLLSRKIEVTPQNLIINRQINSKSPIIIQYIDKIIEGIKNNNDPSIQSIISRLNEFYINADELSSNENIDKSNELLRILAQLESVLEDSNNMSYELKQSMINIRDTISFIKSMNNHINYLYIPIAINEKKTDAEIFVFERGNRSKKIDISNATIVICVNMPSLGYIEGIIEMRSKNLNISFKSADKKTADMIKRYSFNLIDSLSLKGYNISIKSVVKKDKVFDLQSIDELMSPKTYSLNSIDVRI